MEVHLILDVGNGSVAGALVLFAPNTAPKILYTKRLPVSVTHQAQSETLTTHVLGLLEEVVQTISTEGLTQMRSQVPSVKKVSHTYCVLSSPWYVSKTKVLTLENREPIAITTGFVESLLKKEEDIFESEVTETNGEGLAKNDIQVIEKIIIQTKLNGYSTPNPYQKKARQIELAMFMSLASKNVVQSIERIVGTYFYSKHLVFHSFSLAGYRVMGDIFSQESNYVFMDVSAEVTDVSSVENHILMETVSFPLGRNYLVQAVAEAFGVLPEIALSFINMYTSGHAEADAVARIEVAYKKAIADWAEHVAHALKDSIKGKTPTKIYVTVDEEIAPLFMAAIQEQLIHLNEIPDIKLATPVLIDTAMLAHFVEYDGMAKHDPFLALESIFFNKILFTQP